MNNRNPSHFGFQTFFISRETSKCPQLVDILHISKKINELQLAEEGTGSISIRYGRRILINSKDTQLPTLQPEDLVEIVDYDPIKNVVLTMGKKEPCRDTPVHSLIQTARTDINTVILLKNKKLHDQLSNNLPLTEHEAPTGTIDLAKEILKTLRQGKNILIKNYGALFIGVNVQEIEKTLHNITKKRD